MDKTNLTPKKVSTLLERYSANAQVLCPCCGEEVSIDGNYADRFDDMISCPRCGKASRGYKYDPLGVEWLLNDYSSISKIDSCDVIFALADGIEVNTKLQAVVRGGEKYNLSEIAVVEIREHGLGMIDAGYGTEEETK